MEIYRVNLKENTPGASVNASDNSALETRLLLVSQTLDTYQVLSHRGLLGCCRAFTLHYKFP